jgi:hypothetical protein
MNHKVISRYAGLAAGVALLVACGGTPSTTTQAQVQPSPTPAVHTLAGGCAGTVLTDSQPPIWAQGGWTNPKGLAWGVPWALGTDGTTVAYVFATQLVAGPSPRANGTNNKVLWEAKDYPSGGGVMVEGHPLGASQPVVTIAGGPSITDVPAAGCWTFQLSWTANGRQSKSTINLDVLPAGSVPVGQPA